jgi:MerR family mercuric resistance operon transcriptional regulator
MPEPQRTSRNYQAYDDSHVGRPRFIKRARDLGFALDEVRDLLALVDGGAQTCGEVQGIANTRLATVRAKIAALTRIEHVLRSTVAQCTGGDVPKCPVIDVLTEAAQKPSRCLEAWASQNQPDERAGEIAGTDFADGHVRQIFLNGTPVSHSRRGKRASRMPPAIAPPFASATGAWRTSRRFDGRAASHALGAFLSSARLFLMPTPPILRTFAHVERPGFVSPGPARRRDAERRRACGAAAKIFEPDTRGAGPRNETKSAVPSAGLPQLKCETSCIDLAQLREVAPHFWTASSVLRFRVVRQGSREHAPAGTR